MKKGKILITGAAGYVGSIGTDIFLQQKFTVVAVDNFSTGFKAALNLLQKKYGRENLKIYHLDLLDDLSLLFKNEPGISAIIHYAACCQVDESMKNPIKYFDNNVIATQNILKNAIRFKIPYFIFSSSCAMYGKMDYVPIDENHRVIPNNPYGESKKMAEQMIIWYSKVYGLKHVILRYFNVCGASDDGSLGDSKTPTPHLISNLIRTTLNLQTFALTCPKVETADTTPIRDYVNVVDVNIAHLKALEYLLKGGGNEMINLGTGQGFSVLEIVEKIQKITGAKLNIHQNKDKRLGENSITIADYKKAQALLGWIPARSLEHSILTLTKWFINHPYGWNSIPSEVKFDLQIKSISANWFLKASK